MWTNADDVRSRSGVRPGLSRPVWESRSCFKRSSRSRANTQSAAASQASYVNCQTLPHGSYTLQRISKISYHRDWWYSGLCCCPAWLPLRAMRLFIRLFNVVGLFTFFVHRFSTVR